MRGRPLVALFAGAVIAGMLLSQALFVLGPDQQGVVMRLGAPVRVLGARAAAPGLHWKWPVLDRLVRLDRRSQWLMRDGLAASSLDGRRLIAGALVRWRIVDPVAFVRAIGPQSAAADRLSPLLARALGAALAAAPAKSILGGDVGMVERQALQGARREAAAAGLGVDFQSLQLADVDLPPAQDEAIEARMAQGFAADAAQIRDAGKLEARALTAQGDAAAALVTATDDRQAAAIAAEEGTKVGAIYAASYGKDPAFAAFWRSMEAYRKVLADGSATLVLSPQSRFLKYLARPPGAR